MSGINFCCMHICKGPYRYTHMYASTSVAETAGQAHGRATFLGNQFPHNNENSTKRGQDEMDDL